MRDRLVRAAEDVIRDKGLAQSTTKEIAEAAQCSEGALYRHFKGKEELFLTVLAERLPGFMPMLQDLPTQVGKGSVRANLQRVAKAAVEFYVESVPMSASIFADPALMRNHRQWLQQRNAGPYRAIELLAAYLRAERRLGRIRDDVNPEATAHLLLGACYQRAFLQQFQPERSPASQSFVRTLADTLWRGVAPAA